MLTIIFRWLSTVAVVSLLCKGLDSILKLSTFTCKCQPLPTFKHTLSHWQLKIWRTQGVSEGPRLCLLHLLHMLFNIKLQIRLGFPACRKYRPNICLFIYEYSLYICFANLESSTHFSLMLYIPQLTCENGKRHFYQSTQELLSVEIKHTQMWYMTKVFKRLLGKRRWPA